MSQAWTIDRIETTDINDSPTFTSKGLLISVESTPNPNLVRAGYLQVFTMVDGEFYDHSLKLVKLGRSIVSVGVKEYKLVFIPEKLAPKHISIINITPYDVEQIMPIYPSISAGNSPATSCTVSPSATACRYYPEVPSTSYKVLDASNRKTFAVTNNSLETIHLDLVPPSELHNQYVLIPAGSTYTCDFEYQGEVYLWSAGADLPCKIREFH